MKRPGPLKRSEPGHSAAESGFALLIVLWTLVLVALLFAMLTSTSRSDAQLTANLRSAAELEAVADGAIYTALFDLLRRGVARDLAPPPSRLSGAEIGVQVVDQSGLMNPNTASPELLGALLLRLGADAGQANRIAAAVADWRAPGRRSARRGFKAAQYQAAGLHYGPPGAPFETLGELGDVFGMTPALLAALAPHLTLYSDGDPDPAVADPVVRAALRDAGYGERAERAALQTVRITAAAQRGGARAVRSAVIRIGASSTGRGWRILVWETALAG